MYYSNNNNNNNNNETNLFVTAGGREFLVTFGRVSVRLGPGEKGEEGEGGKDREGEREREISINAEQANFVWPSFRSELN